MGRSASRDRKRSLLWHEGRALRALGIGVGAVALLLAASAAAWAEAAATAPGTNKLIEQQLARIPSGEQGVRELFEPLRSRQSLSDEQATAIRTLIEEGVAPTGRIRERFEAGEIAPTAPMT